MRKPVDSGIIRDHEKYVKGWVGGLPETPCGFGSRMDQTGLQRVALARWVKEFEITTLVDVGAGDLNWIRHIKWPHPVAYIPLDLVPRHPDVHKFNLIREVPPPGDMVLCLWVLNHMPENEARKALDNLLAAKFRYLVYTWWPMMFPFLDLGADESILIRPHKAMELRLLRSG